MATIRKLWSSSITVEVNPYDSALFKTGVIQIRMLVGCEVALRCDPAAFTKATSIT